MTSSTTLERARAELKKQAAIYQPTAFWDEASERITREIADRKSVV